MKSKTLTFTYQTRFSCDENMSRTLDTYAELMSRVERSLFADIAAGKSCSELKSSYLVTFGITARQFNAMRVQLEGKIASLKELLPVRIEKISSHIKNLEKKICKIKSKAAVHQKKCSLAGLKRKLSTLVADQDKNKVKYFYRLLPKINSLGGLCQDPFMQKIHPYFLFIFLQSYILSIIIPSSSVLVIK